MKTSSRRYRAFRGRAALPTLAALLLALATPPRGGVAHAQEAPAAPPALRLVMPGDRVTVEGFLIPPDDMAWFRQRIETLEFRLRVDVEATQARCDVQVQLQRELTNAAEARHAVIEAAYEADRAQLTQQIAAAQAEARRAQRSQNAWYRSPVLWFGLGIVSSGALVLAVR